MGNKNLADDSSDKSYILAEYNTLKNEMSQWVTIASSTWTIAILATLTVLGYFIQLDELSFFFYPLPFFIVIPSLFICFASFRAIMRLSGYIRIFLEKEEGLKYENRFMRWRSVFSELKQHKGMSLQAVVFWLHVGLGLLALSVFVWKVLLKDICWGSLLRPPVVPDCWIPMMGQILLYLSPLPFYLRAHQINKKDWRAIYDEYWKKVKETEKQSPNPIPPGRPKPAAHRPGAGSS